MTSAVLGTRWKKAHETAVVLHLFYPELLEEIAAYIQHLGQDYDLYVTIPENQEELAEQVHTRYPEARIIENANRGRDILPFLNALQSILPLNYSLLLKLHSKKTLHRADGISWRQDVFEKLLGTAELVDKIKAAFLADPNLGMLGPIEHVLNTRFYMGHNKNRVQELLFQVGFPRLLPESSFFVASTMFWCRPEIFHPLLSADITLNDFEPEPLSEDGSTAHAMERLFGLMTSLQGYTLKEVSHTGVVSNPDSYHVYAYAPAPAYLRLREMKSLVFYRTYDQAFAIEYLRITAPFRQAGIEVIQGTVNGIPDLEKIKQGDAVIFQREFPLNSDLYDEIVKIAREAGKVIIYEIDDLLFDLPEEHPERKNEAYTLALLPMLSALIEADLVIVPTEKLREILKGYNPNIVVLPNYLDDNIWRLEPPVVREQDVITVGYMGSNSHTTDLELISPALKNLSDKYQSKLKFKIWGTPLPKSLKDLPGVEWQPSPTNVYIDFVEYFQTQSADIFIAPLVDNLFNNCKSPLKFLEYSARGVPGVYSAVEPYRLVIEDGEDGILAASREEWVRALKSLIENAPLRTRLVENAQEKIRKQWLLSRNIPNWLSVLDTLPAHQYQEIALKQTTIHLMNTIRRQVLQMQENSQQSEINVKLQNVALNEHMVELQSQIHEYLAKISQLNQSIVVLSSQDLSLEEKTRVHLETITELGQANKLLNAQTYDYLEELTELNQAKTRLMKTNADSIVRIRALHDELDSLDVQAHYWSDQAHQRTAELAQSTQQLTDAQAAINKIYASRSWKMLAPVRKASTTIGKAKQYLRRVIRPASRLTTKLTLKRDLDIIRASGLFDLEYYLAHNVDVRNTKVDPLKHFVNHGGIEGRAPSAQFDSIKYLNQYPDVKNASMNPLLHYIRFGKAEGRIALPTQETAQSQMATAVNRPVKMIIQTSLIPYHLILEPELSELLKTHLKPKYQLSISHDNYLTITGGSQVSVADEQRKLNDAGESYLHIYPFTKGRYLQAEDQLVYIGINLDGKSLGFSEIRELSGAIRNLQTQTLDKVNIHHTMGFTYHGLQRLLDQAENRKVFWLHDYFSLCPSYNLLRNDNEYCGAPAIDSNACAICHYLPTRKEQHILFVKLFTDNKLEIAAPSHFTYKLWQDRFPIKGLTAHIIPPARLEWQQSILPGYQGGILRVGYLGYPLGYKGWKTWKTLTATLAFDKRYKFFHFSTQSGGVGNCKFVDTRVTKENRMAMVDALQLNQIDVVLLWSQVAETFSFTLHEALAAGAFVLTNAHSGNIQDYVSRNPSRGLILDDSTLISLFQSGKISQEVSRYQIEGRPQADLIIGGLQEIAL